MAPIEDHDYMRLCADLASCLSISISAARRKVELAAARDGLKDLPSRKKIAENLLKEARSSSESGQAAQVEEFDKLLAALEEDENFMVED